MTLRVGDHAPEFTLYNIDGEPHTLSEAESPVHLVFLRHLGCLPEFDYVETLIEHQQALTAQGIQVWMIAFVDADLVRTWLDETGAPFPVLLDTDRAVYHAYGLERSVWRSWHPETLWYYVKRVLNGAQLKPGRGDPNQLGGDFTIAPDGRLAFVHYIRNPTDRPTLTQLLHHV